MVCGAFPALFWCAWPISGTSNFQCEFRYKMSKKFIGSFVFMLVSWAEGCVREGGQTMCEYIMSLGLFRGITVNEDTFDEESAI